MDNSCRGSSISLIESEPSLSAENPQKARSQNLRTRFIFHKYYTRNSVKLKKLFVNLSSSNIDQNKFVETSSQLSYNTEVNSYLINNPITRRNSDTFSEDSKEFDFKRDYFIDRYSSRNLMDSRNRLCISNTQQNAWKTWKKYCYAICALGMLYIYIQVIHTEQNVRKLHKEMDTLKTEVRHAHTTGKVNKIENVLNSVLREQETHARRIENLITKEIEKYSADKTGRTDFALEATGAKIVSLVPGTENYDSAKTLFGLTLCEGIHGPRAMIQADMSPGHCWAFRGTHGGAVIKLLGKVQINAVSLEHISESVSPTGEISSAPKEFTVWGLNGTNDRGQQLGTFIYHKLGPLVQTFPIANTNYYEYAEFRVMSNQGNPEFTCVYRFRVHGKLERDKEL